MRLAAAIGMLIVLGRAAAGEPIVLAFPGERPTIVALDLDDKRAEKSWRQFFAQLFEDYDRDQNGSLDRAEVARLFPLPLPDRKSLTWDFAGLDRDKSNSISREELEVYCRSRGFSPFAVVLQAPTADDARLAPLFFRNLDVFDANDDERIDRREMLAAAKPLTDAVRAEASMQIVDAKPDVTLQIHRGDRNALRLEVPRDSILSLVGANRVRGSKDWIASVDSVRGGFDFAKVRAFLVAQYQTARGDNDAVTRAEVDDDATLIGLQSLFPFADRDGDGRLTPAELDRYLHLIDLATQSQTWLVVADHGRNLFPILDADHNDSLDVAEVRDLPAILEPGAKTPPRCFRISFTPPAMQTWGGVTIPPLVFRPPAATPKAVPAWFLAMDKNGDGYVSAREFLGPPHAFQRLDANNDRLIDAAEAIHDVR